MCIQWFGFLLVLLQGYAFADKDSFYIILETPARASLQTQTQVAIKGKVISKQVPLKSLSLNDQPIEFDKTTGAFDLSYQAAFGLNVLKLVAKDEKANQRTWTSAFYVSETPAPFGSSFTSELYLNPMAVEKELEKLNAKKVPSACLKEVVKQQNWDLNHTKWSFDSNPHFNQTHFAENIHLDMHRLWVPFEKLHTEVHFTHKGPFIFAYTPLESQFDFIWQSKAWLTLVWMQNQIVFGVKNIYVNLIFNLEEQRAIFNQLETRDIYYKIKPIPKKTYDASVAVWSSNGVFRLFSTLIPFSFDSLGAALLNFIAQLTGPWFLPHQIAALKEKAQQGLTQDFLDMSKDIHLTSTFSSERIPWNSLEKPDINAKIQLHSLKNPLLLQTSLQTPLKHKTSQTRAKTPILLFPSCEKKDPPLKTQSFMEFPLPLLNALLHSLWVGLAFDVAWNLANNPDLEKWGIRDLKLQFIPHLPPILEGCHDQTHLQLGDMEVLISFDWLSLPIELVSFASLKGFIELAPNANQTDIILKNSSIVGFDITEMKKGTQEEMEFFKALAKEHLLPLIDQQLKERILLSFPHPTLPLASFLTCIPSPWNLQITPTRIQTLHGKMVTYFDFKKP